MLNHGIKVNRQISLNNKFNVRIINTYIIYISSNKNDIFKIFKHAIYMKSVSYKFFVIFRNS